MRIMAIHAGVAGTRTARQIPIAIHAAVHTFVIIAILRAMALGTQANGVRIFEGHAVGEAQRIVIRRVVAAETGEIAMIESEPPVKVAQSGARGSFALGRTSGVTSRTRYSHRFSVRRLGFGKYHGGGRTGPNGDGVLPR